MSTRRLSRTEFSEAGMTTVEAAVLAPVILVLLLFIVFLGRVTAMQQAVQRSARDAARAASQAITRDEAATAIDAVLDDSLGGNRRHCAVAPTDLTAIGEDTGAEADWDLGLIQVRVTCTIPTSDLGLLGLGTKTFTAVATEPVDTWRSRRVNS